MKKSFQLLTLFTCLTFVSFAQIKIDTVTITAVHDGDSYRVLYKNGVRQWVRLAYVDCPEVISNYVTKMQAYGDSATISVRTQIKGQTMVMRYFKQDIYNRPVVSLEAIGDNDYILSRFIIAHGLGWYMPTSKVPKKYRMLDGVKLQENAKRSRLGLWSLPNPINPKAYRKAHKPQTRKK